MKALWGLHRMRLGCGGDRHGWHQHNMCCRGSGMQCKSAFPPPNTQAGRTGTAWRPICCSFDCNLPWYEIHMKGRRSSSSGLLDRLLIPRVQNYGSNNDITDTEAVCEYLRRNYKEYTRHKLPVFRQQVERAVDAIARKGGVTKAELRLQVGMRGRRPAGGAGPPATHACARHAGGGLRGRR